MAPLIKKILTANRIILSTHKHCDGDGLGSELAVYFALKKINKNVVIINVDETPRKYRFLNPDNHIQYFNVFPKINEPADLCLIFDTNDERLIEPLYSHIKKMVTSIIFIDHHPILKQGPTPSVDSWVDTQYASTGEMAYWLIKNMNIPIDTEMARCIYTSITFDTQLYRYVKNSPNSHLIAAEMLLLDIQPENIHQHLFGHHTIKKMEFLSEVLGQIQYHCDGRIAVLKFSKKSLDKHCLDLDDSRDIIDMIMNIENLEAAAIFREDGENEFKLSLRSKGRMEVLSLAEQLGGGGHKFASGAFIQDTYDNLYKIIVGELQKQLGKF